MRVLLCSLFVFLFCFQLQAFASDYYWRLNSAPQLGQFSSPDATCRAGASARSQTFGEIRKWSDSRFDCYYKSASSGSMILFDNAIRSGDSCPAGTVYNLSTGACDPPEEDPCLPTTGSKIGHRHKLGEISLGTIATTPPPPTVCHESCRYSDPEIDGNPYRFVSGDPSGAWATFSYFGDGDSCNAGEDEADPPSDQKPQADKENSCTNKVCLTVDASGNCQQYTYSCTATEKYTDPGKMDCDFGDYNGASVCVPNSPAPKMTEKEVKTDVEVTENSDGSRDTKTTETTTTTNCSGVGSCSTTSTTNVTNSKTNPDGSAGGSSESCTGDQCKDSEGKSQTDREQEESEEEEKSAVSGEQCDVPVACEGDAIQCAILRQQKDEVCATEKAMDWEGNKQQVTDAVQGEQYQVKEEVIEAPSFISSGTRFLSSGCPSPRRVNLLMGGSVEMDFAPFCSFAEGLAPVIVSCALLFAALYVGRGVGG